MQILFLTLDIFRQTGGIQQVNKLLSQVLNNISTEMPAGTSMISIYSLYDSAVDITHAKPPSYSKYKAFSGNKFRFLYHCLRKIYNLDILILSHIHLLPVAMFLFMLKPRLRIILMAHGAEIRRKHFVWERIFLKKGVEIWAVSRSTAYYLKDCLGDKIRVEVLNNALPPDFIIPDQFGKPASILEKHGLTHDHKVLLTVCRVGRHERDKGIEHVIRSIPALLAAFPKLTYLIVGKTEVSEQHRLQKIIETLCLQAHVGFLNFIPQTELSNYYLLADVFIMPSTREGFGLAFIEAAACGCRVIAGNSDGSADALLDGAIGTLIEPDNLQLLQDTIIQHLESPWHLAQAATIQAVCLKHFSIEVYQERVNNLLHRYISFLNKKCKTA